MVQFKGLDILSTKQFSRDDLMYVMKIAKSMEPFASCKKQSDMLKGKMLASLFFEPSTRTRLSIECSMQRLGGRVVSMAEAAQSSSISKGESLQDMARIVGSYVDVIAMRHPVEGSVHAFASATPTPVLNAGDGPGEHPTQAMIDLYTILKEKGTVDGLTVGMCGDLRYGRTVHSLASLLYHFKVKLVFIAPQELKMPAAVSQGLGLQGLPIEETTDFGDAIGGLDVLYMTRVQRERFTNQQEYEKFARVYELSEKLMQKAKKDLIVMHPLPRITEIPTEIDTDPRAKYFEQARNGIPVRMGLLALVTGAITK